MNVDADRLSYHQRDEGARAEAEKLAARAEMGGEPSQMIDLSDDPT